jgi:hypothetical protein
VRSFITKSRLKQQFLPKELFDLVCPLGQGCQMVYFQTKNPNLDKFWMVVQYVEDVGIFCGHSVNVPDI